MDIELKSRKGELTDEQYKYIAPIASALYKEIGIDYINPTGDKDNPVYVVLTNGQKVIPTVEQIQEGWQMVKAELDSVVIEPSETDTIKSDVETLKTEIDELKALIRQLLEKG
jgi:hypothetical protein